MKTLIAATLFAFASSAALAGPFAYEKPWNDQDLDPSLGGPQITFAEVTPTDVRVSLQDFYQGNPDGYQGIENYQPQVEIADQLPTSYDVFVKGNPDIDLSV